MRLTLVIAGLLLSSMLNASENIQLSKKIYEVDNRKLEYTMPTTFQFVTTMPSNYWSFLKNSFSFTDDNLKGWGAIIVSSAILINYDQKITNNVQKFGRKIGLGNAENTKPTLRVGGSPLLRYPSDAGSAMYFIGDGWVTLGLSAGFLTTGLISNDERAMTVTHELLQGLLLTGITTQAIKRMTGRESPIRSSQPGGKWRPFPKTSDYQETISKYDAFPSGHLATTMTTFVIISENYPEYTWIKPTGYTLMSLLAFQMVNNSVHWAGDYPLALGIGWMLGHAIVNNGRKDLTSKNQNDLTILPYFNQSGQIGLNANFSY